MEKDFVSYNQALKLKALGFDEPCFVKVWWLNSINRHTNEPFKPHITMNGQDIKFEYPIPEKHPFSEFGVLELQVPTFSQAFRWFEDNHQLYPAVVIDRTSYPKWAFEIASFFGNPKSLADQEWGWNEMILSENLYKARLEAESACLDKLLEIVESKS